MQTVRYLKLTLHALLLTVYEDTKVGRIEIMFCSKCGTRLPEGAIFCQKCGTKVTDAGKVQQASGELPVNAGLEDDKQQHASETFTDCQVRKPVIPVNKTGKKKFRKWPLILGITFCAIIAVVVFTIRYSNSYYYKEVNLSKKYENEEEGIFFQYPEEWEEIMDASEYYSSASDVENLIVLLVNRDRRGINSLIQVLKFPADQWSIDHLFISDEEFISTFHENAIILETAITNVSGIDVRRISYVENESLYYLSFFYGKGSDLYRVDFICHVNMQNVMQRFFTAIMGSYTITPAVPENSDFEGNICFSGIPVSEVLGSWGARVVKKFGYTDGNGLLSYNGAIFNMWDDFTIDSITSFYPKYFSINEYALNVGSDELVGLLGQNYEEEWLMGGYYMTYSYPEYSISFCINKFREVEHIVIYNHAIDRGGLSDGTVTGYQEPIDYYYELSGRYSGRVEQSVLSLSIYSSLEEGETAIGNVDISVKGIQNYHGDVFFSSKDIFYVETDTGGKVLLVKSTSDGIIVLQLYVDGQWIEDYWMQEHYES